MSGCIRRPGRARSGLVAKAMVGLLGLLATTCNDAPANSVLEVKFSACDNGTLLGATSLDVTLTDGDGKAETHSYNLDQTPEKLTATLPGDTPNPVTIDVVANGSADQEGQSSTNIKAGDVTTVNLCLRPVNNAYKVTATITAAPVAVIGPTTTPSTMGFRVSSFAFQTPTENDHTSFANVIHVTTQTILSDMSQAVLLELGPPSPDNTVSVTVCNGLPVDGMAGTFQCRTDQPAQQTIAQLANGNTVTGAFDSITINPVVLDAFSFSANIDPTSGTLNAFVNGVLTVAKYCNVTLPTAGLCSKGTVNILDLLDGPAADCGADDSVKNCRPSSDAAGHHPPDAFVMQ
jgi:hypothetical protein